MGEPPDAPAAAVPEATDLALRAADGVSLHARCWRPAGTPRAAVLLAPALGVPLRQYEAFCAWLAQQGLLVLGLDYRGIGGSRPRDAVGRPAGLKHFRARITDWGLLDLPAALDALEAMAPGLPVVLVGNSVGGQLAALPPVVDRIAGVVTVGTGTGFWRHNALPLRRYVWLFWYVIAPLVTRACGWFPGARMGIVTDLPAGVVRQWRAWCLHRGFCVAVEGGAVAEGYARASFPFLLVTPADDELLGPRNARDFLGLLPRARARHITLTPAEEGLRRIGHFGFFREGCRTLWPRMTGWIDETLAARA